MTKEDENFNCSSVILISVKVQFKSATHMTCFDGTRTFFDFSYFIIQFLFYFILFIHVHNITSLKNLNYVTVYSNKILTIKKLITISIKIKGFGLYVVPTAYRC